VKRARREKKTAYELVGVTKTIYNLHESVLSRVYRARKDMQNEDLIFCESTILA
jgi:hypothetical protein